MNITDTVAKRFYTKVNSKSAGCWLWEGSTRDKRYGGFKLYGKSQVAHRVSFEMHCGSIPKGKLICHRCDNPKCVRPSHLFIGSQKDNMRDCVSKGRLKTPKPIRRFNEDDFYTIVGLVKTKGLRGAGRALKCSHSVLREYLKRFGLSHRNLME